MFISEKFKPDDSDEKMISDASEIMNIASYKYYSDLMNNSVGITYKCYSIKELGLNYHNLTSSSANNYEGSVLVQGTSEDSRISIWLSDGKRMASGSLNNVQVIESSEHATENCNMTN